MLTDDNRLNGMSNEAVARATGRDWNAWLRLLDELGGRESDHKGIVALIAGPGALGNGWWQQSVAIGYEQARGLRVVGQTSAGGYQIGVQKTLPIPSEAAWSLVMVEPGLAIWLGTVDTLLLRPGAEYQTREGHWGEIRSVSDGQRVRLTWHSPELAGPSTLQVTITPSGTRPGEKSSVRFHQERLSSLEEREQMRLRWRKALEGLAELANC